ncbi:hypothetical protein [Arcticibacterium luteifluviistationis]|uniref:Uncharacterized protein n=1 Tax=Arcticibacterium luteifluviistationis TaxID=1784714 RepID=A0A2Z4GAW2_9BACT|nr:hypothetical protein [Arcticibacterium luteifluviistationis]AWV98261.1 hypothetical protein DJ013_08800 [Arcticibacterium luteifluviistationis]
MKKRKKNKVRAEIKTLNELKNQEPVYLNDWEESEKIGLLAAFEDIHITKENYEATEAPPHQDESHWSAMKYMMDSTLRKYKNVNILFASSSRNGYNGYAWVLFEENGKLYEVNGIYASIYGLSEQWNKEPVVLIELQNRLEKGTFGTSWNQENVFAAELKAFLGL